MLSDRCPVSLSVCPLCDVIVLWPNGWMDQNETWHGGRPRPWPHCVRWGPSSLPRPMSVVAKGLDGSRCHLVWRYSIGPGDCVRWGPAPPERAQSPEFLAHVYSRQTAGWINIPLGTEVGLGLGDIVLDEEPSPPCTKKPHSPPNFRLMSTVAKRLDASGYHLVRR